MRSDLVRLWRDLQREGLHVRVLVEHDYARIEGRLEPDATVSIDDAFDWLEARIPGIAPVVRIEVEKGEHVLSKTLRFK